MKVGELFDSYVKCLRQVDVVEAISLQVKLHQMEVSLLPRPQVPLEESSAQAIDYTVGNPPPNDAMSSPHWLHAQQWNPVYPIVLYNHRSDKSIPPPFDSFYFIQPGKQPPSSQKIPNQGTDLVPADPTMLKSYLNLKKKKLHGFYFWKTHH